MYSDFCIISSQFLRMTAVTSCILMEILWFLDWKPTICTCKAGTRLPSGRSSLPQICLLSFYWTIVHLSTQILILALFYKKRIDISKSTSNMTIQMVGTVEFNIHRFWCQKCLTILGQNLCVPDIVCLGDRSVLFHSMQNVEHL